MTSETKRAPGGRFAKGVSGNPAGRPKQASTAMREALKEHGLEVIDVVLEKALEGDMVACKLIIDRLCPPLKPQAAPTQINLPEDAGLAGTARAFVNAAASGELPSDHAAQLVQAVGSLARVTEIDELMKRVEKLEKVTDTGEHQW